MLTWLHMTNKCMQLIANVGKQMEIIKLEDGIVLLHLFCYTVIFILPI